MIAPLRQTDPEERLARRRLRKAHDLVASTFLGPTQADRAPMVSSRAAWTFAVWGATIAIVYLAHMIRWL